MKPKFVVIVLVAFGISGCGKWQVKQARAEQAAFEGIVGQCESYGFVKGSRDLSRCVSDASEARRAETDAARARALAEGRAAYKEFLRETKAPAPPPFGIECGPMRDGTYSCAGM